MQLQLYYTCGSIITTSLDLFLFYSHLSPAWDLSPTLLHLRDMRGWMSELLGTVKAFPHLLFYWRCALTSVGWRSGFYRKQLGFQNGRWPGVSRACNQDSPERIWEQQLCCATPGTFTHTTGVRTPHPQHRLTLPSSGGESVEFH